MQDQGVTRATGDDVVIPRQGADPMGVALQLGGFREGGGVVEADGVLGGTHGQGICLYVRTDTKQINTKESISVCTNAR
jgi:hypothetical protein